VVEQPANFRSRKIRIEQQAGFAPEERFVAAVFQLLAETRGAAILPHDGAVDRLTGGALPHERRLALVGDAERGKILA